MVVVDGHDFVAADWIGILTVESVAGNEKERGIEGEWDFVVGVHGDESEQVVVDAEEK